MRFDSFWQSIEFLTAFVDHVRCVHAAHLAFVFSDRVLSSDRFVSASCCAFGVPRRVSSNQPNVVRIFHFGTSFEYAGEKLAVSLALNHVELFFLHHVPNLLILAIRLIFADLVGAKFYPAWVPPACTCGIQMLISE
jgi:hypothetical protein